MFHVENCSKVALTPTPFSPRIYPVMKKSQIRHILDTAEPPPEKDPELVFTHFINSNNGARFPTQYTPPDWGNVRHITGNLYYAYDSAPESGRVYVGEFR
jgi:hypothetical protein